jgi:tetratricopeptide (TPR) repeat protein
VFKISKAQTLTLTGVLILTVLLFLANTMPPKRGTPPSETKSDGPGIEEYVENSRSALSAEQRSLIKELETQFDHATNDQKAGVLDSLIINWSNYKKPIPAAYYSERLAALNSGAENWENAGNRYLAATRFVQPDKRHVIFEHAIHCFEKTLELNPENVNARINMAACLVEGTNDPMKGIAMLKEIEKSDSNNINLQLNFAMFSEKSGQFEKAIQRYNKILQIDSTYIEAYLHLADAYENLNKKELAIRSLEKYLSLIDDATIRTEVKNYINKLSRRDSFGEKQQL